MSNPNVGRFVWYELSTSDPEGAKAFYSNVVGWSTQPFPGSDYTMWVGAQGALGGVSKNEAAPPGWIGSVEVADVDATVVKAKEKGGSVRVPPTDIPNVGRFAVISDPQGAAISIFASSEAMTGHDPNQTGEFSWHELYTSDLEKGIAFYFDLFGWERIRELDMGPMGKYVLYGRHGEELGGMMKAPPGIPHPAWGYTITTADFDAALERAKSKGAKVLNGPMDVPGGQRTVKLLDPQGAAFALVTPRPKD